MAFPLLEVIDGHLGDFLTPQPACKWEGEERSVALAFEPLAIRSLPERGRSVGRQPVAEPDAQLLHTLPA
jgi:hypothetical protein